MKVFPYKMDHLSEDFNFEQIRETPSSSHHTPRNNRIENLETENLMTEVQNNIFDASRRDTMFTHTKLNNYKKKKLVSLCN